ncbi:MAG: DUF1566 domain-containing protein [Candidatus Aureabacteria bacterium]|nr:DUF1566 domain-containing protein [Candidatus Auribacterota bacterium]
MEKFSTAVLGLIFAAGMVGMAFAGSIDSTGAPSVGSGMYTLGNLYDYIVSGTALEAKTSFQEPSAAPGSTMKTTKEIGDTLKTSFDLCNATAAHVESGWTFFSTAPGSWGVQTGTLFVPPTPTLTPTPTPTIEPTWYAANGPSGSDMVANIAGMAVAKWTNNAGMDTNTTKTWDDAVSWSADLAWLDKDDWRLPTLGDLNTICANKGSLGSWSDAGYTWSSTELDASIAWFVCLNNCRVYNCDKTIARSVRAVRGGPTPTPTPIPTSTPTIEPTWYAANGPSGSDMVVNIAGMAVAKWTDNAGTDTNVAKNWADAVSWGTNLVWLAKDDWRLPTIVELTTISTSRGSLGSYKGGGDCYWSSTVYDATYAWRVALASSGVGYWFKTSNQYVRAVR